MHNGCRVISFFFFVLFFCSLNNAYSKDFIVDDQISPYCNGISVDKFVKERKIDSIEIRTNKTRKWEKNLIRSIVEFNSKESKTHNTGLFNFRIKNKYKKKFKSTVIVNFKEKNLTCKFKAKIRIAGDLQWHIKWKNGRASSSIYVQLTDGHINSITRFKLFLPEARNNDNEIFVTSLFKELGFLAPRTQKVNVKVNGVNNKYIFQEDLQKEFLEHLKMQEGPILEGDERFTIQQKDENMLRNLSLARLSNKKFSLKGNSNRDISLRAVSNLNLIYLQSHQIENPNKFKNIAPDRLHINTEKFFLNSLNKKKFQTYEALMYALNAEHGQSIDDRRFYFDPINKYFVPIYYDGKANIMSSKNSILNKSSININIFADAKKGSSEAINLINSIDQKKFIKKINEAGMNISKKDLKNLINNIIIKLNVINSSEPFKIKFLDTKNYFPSLKMSVKKNKKLIFVNLNKKEFYFCDFDLNNCNVEKNSELQFNKKLADALSQRYSENDKKNSLKTKYLFVYDDIKYYEKQNLSLNNWKITKSKDQFVIKSSDDIKLQFFPKKKEINFYQMSPRGRVIISGEKISDWKITFNGYKENLETLKIQNHLGLSGCLTLLDIEVEKIYIDAKNSPCEDAVNFVRVKGYINSMNILNSSSDAVDFDFSNLNVNFLKINSAKNDCLDLSHGIYFIDSIEAENCEDKAISVGEKSKVTLKKVKINKSNIGVAVKDSSIVNVENSKINNSTICFAAYRKKQEFSGSIITITETNCKNEEIFVQKGSKVFSNL